jgi:hypothetical protein
MVAFSFLVSPAIIEMEPLSSNTRCTGLTTSISQLASSSVPSFVIAFIVAKP